LLSVTDKTGLPEFAAGLVRLGVEIIATGNTFRVLREAAVPAIEMKAYTNTPELLDGRVKTLHPRVFAGILGRCSDADPSDTKAMQSLDIPSIDLVVVNFYPLAPLMANPKATAVEVLENLDIGGPAMLRAAAKNHVGSTAVTDHTDYPVILEEIQAHGGIRDALRLRLAARALQRSAEYDASIANYLNRLDNQGSPRPFGKTLNLCYRLGRVLRHGENPHQNAALYLDPQGRESLAHTTPLQGKPLSFNNVLDADTAFRCVRDFTTTACVIVKHASPCGVAISDTPLDAYEAAYRTDPDAAYGSVIAFNGELDVTVLRTLCERHFVEVLIAPQITADGRRLLRRYGNIRVLLPTFSHPVGKYAYRTVAGGLLAQEENLDILPDTGPQCVTERTPTESETDDLLFAWKVARFVQSNAIVYARNGHTVGIGGGQPARNRSARIAALGHRDKGLDLSGAVMASDAFLPFRDGLDVAACEGIKAVIQPGGSIRDREVIAAANESGIAMLFTGMRHFRH